jgi:hypothetical protein
MLPREYGSGSTHVIEGFRSGLIKERIFEKLWIRLLEYMMIFAAAKNGNGWQ